MNIEKAKWLRGYLQALPPEEFDYGRAYYNGRELCGCVSHHIHAHESPGVAESTNTSTIAKFLEIDYNHALTLFTGNGGAHVYKGLTEKKGSYGIQCAIDTLDIIAATYGVDLKAEPLFVGDEAAYLAELRAFAAESVGA